MKTKNVEYVGMRYIQDCRDRANTQGLSPKETKIANAIYNQVAQYRHASRVLARGEIYTRQTPQTGGNHYGTANTMSAYRWNGTELETVFKDLSIHRAKQALKAFGDFQNGKIEVAVWDNYIHNGYMTRRGLYADYSEAKLNRIGVIANSHADCVAEGKAGHEARVAMRNTY